MPADTVLTDGTIALIRTMRTGDREGLLRLHEDISDRSLLMRFFTISRISGRKYVEHLVQGTGDTVITLVAEQGDQIVAAATAERISPHSAEVAVLVAESLHGRGLGSLLLEHLAAACRDRGIYRLTAEVLAENAEMLKVLQDGGFEAEHFHDGSTVRVELLSSPTSSVLRAADSRDFVAESRSLAPLLYPSSVVIVGVRRNGKGNGTAVLRHIAGAGFTGQLHVIHPSARTLLGMPCHPTLADVPGHVDLVVIAVPAEHVLGVLEDAAAKGVGAALVLSSGFGELGLRGEALQRDILHVARTHSIRLVGPDSLGILDNDPDVRLDATVSAHVPPPGGLALATQSGGVGIALLDLAREHDLGVHALVSLGDKTDVSSNDLLAAWYDDPRVQAVGLHLESFGNAPKFVRIARRFSERKPILATAGGTSGTLGVEALFAQAGIIACRTIESLAVTALVLQQQPLPAGSRVGVVSNAHGVGVLAADGARAHHLVVPEFSRALQQRLRAGGTSATTNPADLGTGADAALLESTVRAVLASGEVDTLVVPVVATGITDGHGLARALGRARRDHPAVPVLMVAIGGLEAPRDLLEGVTVLHTVEAAMEAVSLTTRYAEWRRTPHAEAVDVDDARAVRARSTARGLLAGAEPTGTWLRPEQADALLDEYGIRALGALAEDPEEAAAKAVEIGFPVVVKVADRTVPDKSERGLVATGVSSRREVRAVVRGMARELRRRRVPVVVQPTVRGVELAVRIVRDPEFGPLVIVAAGGAAEAVWADRVCLLPPVSRRDVDRALRSLRIWPLLEGHRGSPRVNLRALEQLVLSLGQLATEVPEVAEVDVSPVMAAADGVAMLDVKVRLDAPSPSGAFLPRQLRPEPPAR